ncbi:MAG: hypothetical protein ABIJ34_08540 [archaeon]
MYHSNADQSFPVRYISDIARTADLDRETFFRQPDYRPSRIHYRITPCYIRAFMQVPKPNIYVGSSSLERYFLRNRMSGSINLEYAVTSSYAAASDYNSLFITSAVIHSPEIFLLPGRPETEFIENISPRIKKTIGMIFKLTMEQEFPEDILISVLDEILLEKEHSKHSRTWSNSIQGFAINRKHLSDFSSVFVRQNPLDMLLLTIGHEIGHCMSVSCDDPVQEEAKAFAFEIAWMNTIHKFNILNLRDCLDMDALRPEKNGLHDVALDHVRKMLFDKTPIEIFKEICDSID